MPGASALFFLGDLVQDRQDEGAGLARAGLGQADGVASGHNLRDQFRLNRGWLAVTRAFNTAQDGAIQFKALEGRQRQKSFRFAGVV